jgi:hypothetical protein
MINADVEFLTGLIALKTEEFSGLVDVLGVRQRFLHFGALWPPDFPRIFMLSNKESMQCAFRVN